MAENINLNKLVFNKREYEKSINTSFTELGVQTIQEQIDEQPTVQEFFDMYNELFYEIPETGPNNSHEYLIQTSTEYINFDQNDELVQALQNEIAQLRTEILELQKQEAETEEENLNITTDTTSNVSVSSGTSTSGGSSSGGGGGGY